MLCHNILESVMVGMGRDGGHQLRISGRGRWKQYRRVTTAAFVVGAWAGVVYHRRCWGYDGGGVSIVVRTPRDQERKIHTFWACRTERRRKLHGIGRGRAWESQRTSLVFLYIKIQRMITINEYLHLGRWTNTKDNLIAGRSITEEELSLQEGLTW